jgi:hypothetical protein
MINTSLLLLLSSLLLLILYSSLVPTSPFLGSPSRGSRRRRRSDRDAERKETPASPAQQQGPQAMNSPDMDG